MALRSTARVLSSSGKPGGFLVGEGGLRGLMQRVRERILTGKILRPDVEDDVLRLPVEQSGYRAAAPGVEQAVVPQGPYKNVFDITYHDRDSRRRNTREELTAEDLAKEGLPPTAGVPPTATFLGMAGDFDRQ